MTEIRYCPVCGAEIEPLFGFDRDGSAETTVECPEHGEVMIEFYDRQ